MATLHIFFFPFLAHGHIIPTVDMAKLFASKGVKATIVTTPLNAPLISKAIAKSKTNNNNNRIHIQTIDFPCEEVGLPKACENMDSIPSPDSILTFFKATRLLQNPLEQLLHQHRPHCVVADAFYPWATDSASKFGIPRIGFHGTCFFSVCAAECMRLYEPFKNVSSDSEYRVIPHLPGEIRMAKTDVPVFVKNSSQQHEPEFAKLLEEAKEAEAKSLGVIFNSFYELEKAYADYYTKELGKKAWHIGPVSLCNRDTEEKAQRGKEACIEEHEWLNWLDGKEPNSVVYVCFGSLTKFPDSQLRDIARGLEGSGQQFMWVVVGKSKRDGEGWLPEGFERRMEGKGLVIRGWAPQVLILAHEAIGAFVTHCGWNSILEGVSAGVPMVTWPVAAEQFCNEKLVTEVLGIGVPVGFEGESSDWEKGVKSVMVGEEAGEMRKKAKVLRQLARRAVEEGGSSHSCLNALIEELGSLSQLY